MSESKTAGEKKNPKTEQGPQKQAEQARRNYEIASRKVSDWAEMWPVCTHPRCLRARRCNGNFASEGLPCFARATGETKLWVDKLCEVVAEGGSIEEANEVAGTAVLDLRRHKEMDRLLKETVAYARKVLKGFRRRMREEEEEDKLMS